MADFAASHVASRRWHVRLYVRPVRSLGGFAALRRKREPRTMALLPFGDTPGARDPRALAILAKTIYRELRSSGFEERDVMALAGELLAQVASEVRARGERSRRRTWRVRPRQESRQSSESSSTQLTRCVSAFDNSPRSPPHHGERVQP